MSSTRRLGVLVASLVLACSTFALAAPVPTPDGPAKPGEVDRYLPPDTEFVLTFNFRQLFDSALAKKLGLEDAKDAFKDVKEIQDVLAQLDFDPFKHLDQMIVASPGTNNTDKGLIIVYGKFDQAKFKAMAAKVAKEQEHLLKIHKAAGTEIYEVAVPGGDQPLFVALASSKTVLAAPGKDYVVDALKRVDKPGKMASKEMQSLLEKMDPKHSLAVAGVGSALKGPLGDLIGAWGDKIVGMGGGITLTDELRLEVVVGFKNADDAKTMHKDVDQYLTLGLGLLAGVAAGQEELKPLVEVAKSLRVSRKDHAVSFKATITADIIEELIKGIKDLIK